MRWSTLGVMAAFVLCFPAIASADYVYNISFGNNPNFFVTGTIATSCDNSCSLNSSNITAWSLTNSDDGSPTTVASTDPSAQILGTPGNDLVATSQVISFNFPDTNPREIYFSSVNGQQQLVTAGVNGGPGYYTVCLGGGSSICILGDPVLSNLQLGTLQSPVVPLPAAFWLLLSGLGALGAFPRARLLD
jgi:hypothetical protein